MVKILYGVEFADRTWHNGYDHRSDDIKDAFLSDREWAEGIAELAKPYGLNPTVRSVVVDIASLYQLGCGKGEHPDLPLTPLALVCELNLDDTRRGHFSF